MKIAIMQPTFIPWIGYFNLIKLVDKFIFLDDVQFDKRSWQQRNRILVNNQPHFLTIPVKTKNKFSQLINQVEIDYDTDWVKKHSLTLKNNYGKCKFFEEFFSLYYKILISKSFYLCDLNIKIIKLICNYLNLNREFYFSSIFKAKDNKTSKIINILNNFDNATYLSTIGSNNYLEEKLFIDNKINLKFFEYIPQQYHQKTSENFISHLSILDFIFNHGKNTENIFI